MNDLVLARYQEDITWAEDRPDDWRLHVVQIGRDVPVESGYEATAYLWWILRRYDDFPTGTICLSQAWPFDHAPDFRLRLVDRYTPQATELAHTNPAGEPYDMAAEARDLGYELPAGGVAFNPGACMLVPAATIRAHPREFYERLLEYSLRPVEPPAHVLERLWHLVFAET